MRITMTIVHSSLVYFHCALHFNLECVFGQFGNIGPLTTKKLFSSLPVTLLQSFLLLIALMLKSYVIIILCKFYLVFFSCYCCCT